MGNVYMGMAMLRKKIRRLERAVAELSVTNVRLREEAQQTKDQHMNDKMIELGDIRRASVDSLAELLREAGCKVELPEPPKPDKVIFNQKMGMVVIVDETGAIHLRDDFPWEHEKNSACKSIGGYHSGNVADLARNLQSALDLQAERRGH